MSLIFSVFCLSATYTCTVCCYCMCGCVAEWIEALGSTSDYCSLCLTNGCVSRSADQKCVCSSPATGLMYIRAPQRACTTNPYSHTLHDTVTTARLLL